jgi:hypothetical protein
MIMFRLDSSYRSIYLSPVTVDYSIGRLNRCYCGWLALVAAGAGRKGGSWDSRSAAPLA